MPRLVLLLALLLGGCTSVSEYYSPEVDWSDWTTVGACGNKFEVFKRDISDGVTLEMIGPYFYLFRLSKGKTLQFNSNIVKVKNIDTGSSINIEIKNIKTGVLDKFYRNLYRNIEEKSFDALEEFQGTGSYEQMDMKWGEWSAFRGKRDIFRIDIEKPDSESKATVEIDLPLFLVQGEPVKMDPIIFRWKKGTSLACVQ